MDYVVITTLNGNTRHYLHHESLESAQMTFRNICDANSRFAVVIRNYATGEIVALRDAGEAR